MTVLLKNNQNGEIFNVYKKNDYLSHHGILGQKWGVRRFQNKDGSLTAAGKKRQQKETIRSYKKDRSKLSIDLLKDTYGNRRYSDAEKYAARTTAERLLESKYGSELVTQVAKRENISAGIKFTAALATASTVAVITGIKLNEDM